MRKINPKIRSSQRWNDHEWRALAASRRNWGFPKVNEARLTDLDIFRQVLIDFGWNSLLKSLSSKKTDCKTSSNSTAQPSGESKCRKSDRSLSAFITRLFHHSSADNLIESGHFLSFCAGCGLFFWEKLVQALQDNFLLDLASKKRPPKVCWKSAWSITITHREMIFRLWTDPGTLLIHPFLIQSRA